MHFKTQKDESKKHDKAGYNCCNTHVTKVILDLFFEVHETNFVRFAFDNIKCIVKNG